ncbi:MAG: hypothetical protein COA41_17830 [Sphingopyxis sp.]|nr:MAG: hypothetical protein COA41_17830 [Sphingopyxis sp.]
MTQLGLGISRSISVVRTGKLGLPKSKSVILLLAGTVLLGGCATSRVATPEVVTDLPSAFSAVPTVAGPVDETWWENFRDDQLTAYVVEAVTESPAIGQAIGRVQQARAQATIQGANLLPSVNAGLSGSRSKQTIGAATNNFGLSVDVAWEVDLWGKLSSQSAAARADFLASASNLRAVRQAIAAETSRGYFGVIEAQQQVALSEKVVGTFGEITRQISNRADVGIAAPNDKTLAIANLESSRAGLAQRREAEARITRQFDILLRNYPDGQITVAGALPPMPAQVPAGLPSELLARRPDVQAAMLALQAAGYRTNAAEKSLLPSINLTGSAGTADSAISNILNPDFFIWSIAGQLLQPIFQGGRLRAQIDLNEGAEKEALEAYVETVLQALSEVETALSVESKLADRENSLLIAANAAEKSVGISFNRYRAGIDPFLTVLESQQRALDSRSAYFAARRARLENRVALHLALGGGFEESPTASLDID